MARLEGFEPPAHGLEGRCSIRLSYRRKPQDGFSKGSAGAQRKQVSLPLTVTDYSMDLQACQQIFKHSRENALTKRIRPEYDNLGAR